MDCRKCKKWIENNDEANKITCARCHEPLKYELAAIARESDVILNHSNQGHGRRPCLTANETVDVQQLCIEQHMSYQKIADKFGVSKSTIENIIHPEKMKKFPSCRRPSAKTLARRAKKSKGSSKNEVDK